MAGTLHARRARGSVRRMSTALSIAAPSTHAPTRARRPRTSARSTLFPSGLTHDARRQDPFPPCVDARRGRLQVGSRRAPPARLRRRARRARRRPLAPGRRRGRAPAGRARAAPRRRAASSQADWAERIVDARAERRARALHLQRHRGDAARAARRARLHRPRPRAQAGRPLPRLARRRDARRGAAGRPRAAARARRRTPTSPSSIRSPRARSRRELARGDVACVILEPTGAAWGAVPLPPERVASIAAAARAHGALVVFDEVVTGFRWSPGGAQAVIGVTPDLTRARQGRRRRPARRRAGGARGRHGGARLPRGPRPRSSTRARTTRIRCRPRPASRRSTCWPTAPRLAGADAVGGRAARGALRGLRGSARRPATPTARPRRSASSSASAPTTR